MFYTGIVQLRDVLPDLLAALLPDLTSNSVQPISQQLHITGKVQGVGYRQWLKREAALHAVTATIANMPTGNVDVVVHGQPNAISALIVRCQHGPEMAEVREVLVNDWAGEIPTGIEIVPTPAVV